MSVEDTQPLITHLIELRKRLLNCIIAVMVIFLALVYFANDIYHMVAAPLIKQMPQGATMIATDVATPFLIPMKLTLYVSLFLAIPYVLYQIWAFVAPGLYQHERKLVLPLAAGALLGHLLYLVLALPGAHGADFSVLKTAATAALLIVLLLSGLHWRRSLTVIFALKPGPSRLRPC